MSDDFVSFFFLSLRTTVLPDNLPLAALFLLLRYSFQSFSLLKCSSLLVLAGVLLACKDQYFDVRDIEVYTIFLTCIHRSFFLLQARCGIAILSIFSDTAFALRIGKLSRNSFSAIACFVSRLVLMTKVCLSFMFLFPSEFILP